MTSVGQQVFLESSPTRGSAYVCRHLSTLGLEPVTSRSTVRSLAQINESTRTRAAARTKGRSSAVRIKRQVSLPRPIHQDRPGFHAVWAEPAWDLCDLFQVHYAHENRGAQVGLVVKPCAGSLALPTVLSHPRAPGQVTPFAFFSRYPCLKCTFV